MEINVATLSSASVGANSPDYPTNAKGLVLIVDVTAISGTGASLTATIQGKDPNSGKYFTVLASAALTAIGTTVLSVYPGLTAAANSVVNGVIPHTWRVSWAIAGTTPSVTATIGASLIP